MGEAIKVKEKIYLGQHLRKFGAVYAFIILVIVDSILNKNFLALNTLWNLSIQVLPILLTALGMLLVISTSGIDISTGSLMAVAGVLCAKFITGQITLGGGSILLAMLAGLLAATLLGALNGALIAQFKIQPIIVTLVLYIAGRGVAQLMSNGTTLVFYNTPFNDLGVMRLFGQMPLQLLLEIIFVAVFALLMQWVKPTEETVRIFNQLLKVVSVAIGTYIAVGRGQEGGLLRGSLIGLLYMALGVAAYALLSGQGAPWTAYLADLAMGTATGGIIGAIVSNISGK